VIIFCFPINSLRYKSASLFGNVSASAIVSALFHAAIGAVAGVDCTPATHLWIHGEPFSQLCCSRSNPFILALSTVPYQEILMLAGLFFAFICFLRSGLPQASLSLVGLFTRYEAWAALPVLVLALAVERKWRPMEVVKAAMLFDGRRCCGCFIAGHFGPVARS